MNAVTIVDGVTVSVETIEQELARASAEEWATVSRILEAEKERDLTERLTKSIDLSSATRFPDDMLVIWEGEETTWASLAGNERMCCEVNKDGVLEGGYPI
jgi:hypothetical protein